MNRHKEIECANTVREKCKEFEIRIVVIKRSTSTVTIACLDDDRRIVGLRYPHFIDAESIDLEE